jgi:F-type H+-transporting ATPase subunit gamma
MPSLIDLRRRIRAVKNTQQITKAMKMVAASKLRRAQERVMNARPFVIQAHQVLASVAARVDPSIHALLEQRDRTPAAKTLVIVVTGDKGLCGSFNTNVIKSAATWIIEAGKAACELGLVGRKGRDFFARRGFSIAFEQVGIFHTLKFEDAQSIAQHASQMFLERRVDRVMLVFNEFKSVMSQRLVVEQLLPIAPESVTTPPGPQGASPGAGYQPVEYLYEPSAQEIYDRLLPRYVEVQVYRALLESNAAFFAAQMTAMDAATKNSAEMIANLTLYMNKVRQAAITREIIEVVSGAAAT